VDTLKIAKPFVDEIGGGGEQERLAAAILRLGATLGLDTLAEGIETAPQRDALRALKCRYGQGFFFSRPLPAREIDAMLGRALVA
jgi:EAL domain-containing protein (putative c-di-GMP-specific phosphodiesterase class I)